MSGGGDKSAKKAAAQQTEQLRLAIGEQRAAYKDASGLISPYTEAGTQALGAYQSLLGLGGADEQAAAISNLQSMPGYQTQLAAGQNAVLQNASATGGLRGGNVQTGLADFSQNLLGTAINNQLSQLGNFQQQGLNASTNLANIRAGTAGNISNAYSQIGSAQGNATLAAGSSGGLGGILSGGATGAAAGAAFGPWGAAIGGGLGAIGGGK